MWSLTGLSIGQFEILPPVFTFVYEGMREKAYEAGMAARERKKGLRRGQQSTDLVISKGGLSEMATEVIVQKIRSVIGGTK